MKLPKDFAARPLPRQMAHAATDKPDPRPKLERSNRGCYRMMIFGVLLPVCLLAILLGYRQIIAQQDNTPIGGIIGAQNDAPPVTNTPIPTATSAPSLTPYPTFTPTPSHTPRPNEIIVTVLVLVAGLIGISGGDSLLLGYFEQAAAWLWHFLPRDLAAHMGA